VAAPTKALRSLTLIPLPTPRTGEHVSGVAVASAGNLTPSHGSSRSRITENPCGALG